MYKNGDFSLWLSPVMNGGLFFLTFHNVKIYKVLSIVYLKPLRFDCPKFSAKDLSVHNDLSEGAVFFVFFFHVGIVTIKAKLPCRNGHLAAAGSGQRTRCPTSWHNCVGWTPQPRHSGLRQNHSPPAGLREERSYTVYIR